MAIGDTMGLLNQLIQQNPNIQNQMFQPPMTSVSGGVNSFPNAFDPGSQKTPFGTGMRTADFRDSNNDGIDDRDQGFQNLPGANQGINLPINIGNNPSLPNTRFGAGVRRIVDPSVQPTLIQDQMFQPPMQQPVQNQMPVANSFLEQLQQSAGLLQNQVTALQPSVINNVPQNRFVGNQFQMPFGMGQPTPFGGNYGSGGFNLPYNPGSYTPGAFNQYGNIGTTAGIDNIINSLLGPGAGRGGEGDSGGYVDNRSLSDQVNDVYGPYAAIKQLVPLGYLNNAYTRYKLDKQYGIGDKIEGSQYSEVYNDAIANGATPSEATQRATIMGGGTYTDATFDNANLTDMSINDQLRALEKELYGTNVTTPTEQETTFGDFIGGLFGFGNQDGGNNNNSTTGGVTGAGTDGTGGPDSNYGGNNSGGNNNGGSNSGGQQSGGGSGQSGPAAGAAGLSSFCFSPDTLIQMADGSEKEIQNIKLGDNTKGGKVELVVQTLGHNVYNYKGVEVSGSHWVVEDGEYIEVETSKHAKPIDDKEMLYCLNTSDHAIWVKEIQFSDFIGFGLDYSVPGVHKFWESIKDKHTESIN